MKSNRMKTLSLALLFAACIPWACFKNSVHPSPSSQDEDGLPRVGRQITDFTLGDYRGRQWSLEEFTNEPILVVMFLGIECPIVKLYASNLVEMDKHYRERGARFIAIDSNRHDSIKEIAHFARINKFEFPFLRDSNNKVADLFGAQRTPEVFVLDSNRKVRYYGAIDDRYTYGLQREKAKRSHLVTALDELLAGKEISVPETESIGCHIGRVLQVNPDSEVTYTNQISRIIQKHCIECHREGEIAPFEMTDYEEVVGWAEMMEEVVRDTRMPPWYANPEYGEFHNDPQLSAADKELLYRWVANGAPEGDPADMPEPRQFVKGWRIGTPDMIVPMAYEPFKVPATGVIPYQFLIVDPGFKEDKWVKAAECRPGNTAVVHHIIVDVLGNRRVSGRAMGRLDSEWLAATVPGCPPMILPEGHAKFVPAGSRLAFQMHYTPNGTPQEDISSIGLIFADPSEVKKRVVTQHAANIAFSIPPHAENYRVDGYCELDEDTQILSFLPHLHTRGKAFRYIAEYPDGSEEILLDVPNYDFNWQLIYEYAEPKLVPAGTTIHSIAYFDNSENNFANPDPTATVRWGSQTWDEMMIGYFDSTMAHQDLTTQVVVSRVSKFMKRVKEGKLDVQVLQTAAKTALHSAKQMAEFNLVLKEQLPQIDRVCWMSIEGEQLIIKQVAQEAEVEAICGGAGLSYPAKMFVFSRIARGSEHLMCPDLSKSKDPGFPFMSRGLSSSLHFPVLINGKQGTINYWSDELNGFPQEAVDLLGKLAQDMAKGAANPGQGN